MDQRLDGPRRVRELPLAERPRERLSQVGPAVLSLAQRLYQFPVGIFAIALATAIFPAFSRHAAEGDLAGMGGALSRGIRIVSFEGLPSMVGLILIREPLVRLLFGHGEFQEWPEATQRVSFAVLMYSLGIWAFSLLTESRGVLPQAAGLVTGSYWAAFTIGRFLAGLYTRRVGVHTLVQASLLGALLGSALLWANAFPALSLIGVALIGFSIAPIFPALVSGTSQRVGARYAALGVLDDKGKLERFIPVGMAPEEVRQMAHPPLGLGLIGVRAEHHKFLTAQPTEHINAPQTLAEALAGMAFAQLINPGAPVVLGSFASSISMQSGAPTFGTPEPALVLYTMAALARRLGVPFRSGGSLCASKVPE